MMNEVKLTLIIPTKNRYITLKPVVEAILNNIEDDSFEVVIQDNSNDNEEFLNYIGRNKDQRLKYFYCSDDISIVENTVKAIDNSNGKYLMFIGDDDLISPFTMRIIDYIDEKGIECLVYNAGYYWWDTVEFEKETYYHKKQALWLPNNRIVTITKHNSNVELETMLDSGAGIFSKMPKFYHGIVAREVLEKVKTQTGTYLPGSSPDISFSTAIALVIKEYYYLNFPLSVFGASNNSGGGMTASKRHYGKIEEQKFLPKDILEKWNKYVPLVWSERSIYAQSVTEVAKSFKIDDKFNYVVFYATMLAYEPYLFKYIMPVVKSYSRFNLIVCGKILAIYLKKKLGIYFRKIQFMSKTFNYDIVIAKNPNEVMKILLAGSIGLDDFFSRNS